jgi:hypothetical protein
MQRFMILASLAVLVSTVQPAAAGKYCLQGRTWGFPGNCQFSSRRQCMEAASGTSASCGINPRYAHTRQRGAALSGARAHQSSCAQADGCK